MKFRVPNSSYLQDPWLGGYCPQIHILSVLCPLLNFLNPSPTEKNFWESHWFQQHETSNAVIISVVVLTKHKIFATQPYNEKRKSFV